MQPIKFGPFEVIVTLRDITIKRDLGSVTFLPPEWERIVNLIMRALSLRKMKVLPEKINHSPIHIRFTAERLLYFYKDGSDGEVAFKFDEGDDLIKAVKNGVQKFKDMTTVQKGPKKSFSSSHIPDPII